MHVTVRIEGINLEKLLRAAADSGIVIRSARRNGAREMRLCVRMDQLRQLEALCVHSGWTCILIGSGRFVRLFRLLRARFALVPSMVLCAALVMLSSQMILSIRIEGGGKSVAEIRRVLADEAIYPGRMKRFVSLDTLRAQLAHRLPDLAYAGAYYTGSTLVIDCHDAIEGEELLLSGSGRDIVAARSGIVSRIWAASGTPMVEPGQAVHKGQVLIAGFERSEKGTQIPIQAQGAVQARIYVLGEAKVSMTHMRVVETGQTRTRVTLCTPWSRRVLREAEPFSSQIMDKRIQRVVGLYLPLWREIETYVQTHVFPEERKKEDAASMAQGAAEKNARKQCPHDALILDKRVNYSMIDNEFVYASVVLEFEAPIAGRIQSKPL